VFLLFGCHIQKRDRTSKESWTCLLHPAYCILLTAVHQLRMRNSVPIMHRCSTRCSSTVCTGIQPVECERHPCIQVLLRQLAALVRYAPVHGTNKAADAATTTAVCHVVNAVVRLICHFPPPQQPLPLTQACQPAIDILVSTKSGQEAPPRAAFALRVISAVFQRFGQAVLLQNESRLVFLQLVEGYWKLLLELASSPAAADATVVDALCCVLCDTVSSAGQSKGALLAHVAPTLQRLFLTSGHPACLEALGDAAERTAGTPAPPGSSPEELAPLYAALGATLDAVQRRVATSTAVPPDALSAMLAMLSRFAIFHPRQLLQESQLSPTLQLAMHALRMPERPVVQNVLTLLAHVLTPNPSQQNTICTQGVVMEPVRRLVTVCLPAIVRQVLLCLCSTCPQDSWRAVGVLLFNMTAMYGTPAETAFRAVLLDSSFEAIVRTPLSAEDCHKTLHIMAAHKPLPERRFCALLSDFAGIAHGVCNSGDLIAHEMAPRRLTVDVTV
jgi:hypothetical protein